MTYPNIVAFFDQHEREASLFFREAYPDLAVHHQTMMKVDNFLLHTLYASIDSCTLFTFAPAKPMQAQQIAISCLDYMLLGIIPVKSTEIDKIGRVGYRRADGILSGS